MVYYFQNLNQIDIKCYIIVEINIKILSQNMKKRDRKSLRKEKQLLKLEL